MKTKNLPPLYNDDGKVLCLPCLVRKRVLLQTYIDHSEKDLKNHNKLKVVMIEIITLSVKNVATFSKQKLNETFTQQKNTK